MQNSNRDSAIIGLADRLQKIEDDMLVLRTERKTICAEAKELGVAGKALRAGVRLRLEREEKRTKEREELEYVLRLLGIE